MSVLGKDPLELLGIGVSAFSTCVFRADGGIDNFSRSLKLHGLRIPTLVGVNPNERLAKQIVSVSVEIDRTREDRYAQLEELVVKVCSLAFPDIMKLISPSDNRRILV